LTLRGVRRLSLRHFIDEYEYDDFLEGEGPECATPRALALAFGTRFLDAVPSEYANVLSIALVSFLAECCGRKQLDTSDIDAIKTLVSLPTKDEKQLGQWLDAYFRDAA
jgi:hypothetical protein